MCVCVCVCGQGALRGLWRSSGGDERRMIEWLPNAGTSTSSFILLVLLSSFFAFISCSAAVK